MMICLLKKKKSLQGV